jgi:hypothetical protein
MPRDAFGVFTPIAPQNPVVAGNVIVAADFNDTMDDIATALTESVNTAGTVGFTAPILAPNGNAAGPGYSFTSDATEGMFRMVGHIGISENGAEVARFGSTYSGIVTNFKYVADATWPAAMVGPQVSTTMAGAGTDTHGLIREIQVDVGMSPYAYVPTVGTRRIEFEILGGGGGGGGLPISDASSITGSSGGGGGAYAKTVCTAAEVEVGYTVTIGAAGTGGAAAGNGVAGGDTTVQGVTSATWYARAHGGAGCNVGSTKDNAAANDPPTVAAVAAGGAAWTGDITYAGLPSTPCRMHTPSAGYGIWQTSMPGGNYLFTGNATEATALYPGVGGPGVVIYETAAVGGTANAYDGAPGICIIREYC